MRQTIVHVFRHGIQSSSMAHANGTFQRNKGSHHAQCAVLTMQIIIKTLHKISMKKNYFNFSEQKSSIEKQERQSISFCDNLKDHYVGIDENAVMRRIKLAGPLISAPLATIGIGFALYTNCYPQLSIGAIIGFIQKYSCKE